MTTLNVQAVITAVDRLSPQLATIGGRVAAMQRRFNGAAVAAAGLGQGAGIAAAGIIAAVASGQAELDGAIRSFQIVGTATNRQRGEMRALANDVAVKLGVPQLELIQGATELLQAGLNVEDLTERGSNGVTMFQNIGEAAKVAGSTIGDMAKELVVLAKAFEMPWANSAERMESMKQLQGLAIVAPRLSPDSPTEHVRALAEFGAIAAQLGIAPKEASALQSVLSSAGFVGSRGGMALKTILQRLVNPTPAAQAQMSAAGFNFGKIFRTDLASLNADQIINGLGMGGVHAEKARAAINRHLKKGRDGGDTLDILRWRAELEDQVSSSLGLKKGDAQNRRIIKKSLDNIIAAKQGGLNVVAFLEELQKMPIAAFKDLFGLHHATKGAVLKFRQSLSSYEGFRDQIDAQAPTAVSDGLIIKLAGFDYQVRRLSAAWTSFKDNLNTTGTFGAVLDKISDTLKSLTEMDPARLDMLSKGIAGLGIGLAGIAAASAGVWAVAKLGALLTGPLGKVLMAGGLTAWAGGFNPDQAGGVAPVLRLLQEGGALAGELTGLFDDVATAALGLAGINFTGSAIIKGLGLMSETLASIRGAIEYIRGGGTIGDHNKDWGLGDLLKPFDAEGYARRKRGEAEPEGWNLNPMPNGLPAPYDDWWGQFKSWWSADPAALGASGGADTSAIVQRLDSPLQVRMSEPPIAKLEGSGSVNVTVRVAGPGELTSVSAADDGKNIKLNTGGGMPDTNR